MALKINLKDGESVYFGGSKVTVVHDGGYTILVIDGNSMPVMKEAETISLDDADTPQKRLYYHMQQYYLEGSDEHLRLAEAVAVALSPEEKQAFQQTLTAFSEERQFKGLKLLRGLAGL